MRSGPRLPQVVHDEVPSAFLSQQHDLRRANWNDWTPRADDKVWTYETEVVPR